MSLRQLIGLGGLAGIALVAMLGAAPAQAHNALVSSTPSAGAVVTEQVGTFAITTSDVLLDSGTDSPTTFIQVRGPGEAGLYYGDGCATVDGASVTMPADLGEAGEYTVYWGAVSTDGHPITGDYTFTWQPAVDQQLGEGIADAPSCGATASEEPAPDAAAPVAPSDTATAAPVADDETASGSAADIVWIGVALGVLIVGALVVLAIVRARSRSMHPEDDDSLAGTSSTEPDTRA